MPLKTFLTGFSDFKVAVFLNYLITRIQLLVSRRLRRAVFKMFTGLREGQDVVIKQFTKMVKVDFCRGEYAFMYLYATE